MRTNKECRNCWFYCHRDSRCYAGGVIFDITGTNNSGSGVTVPDAYSKEVSPDGFCLRWAFDGLEEWEREEIAAEAVA